MKHSNRMIPYMISAAVLAFIMLALGAPRVSLAPLLFVIVCPLMMFLMMRGMSGMSDNQPTEDHTGHGCEHDPTRKSETSSNSRP